jgi:hypothetical protein
MKNIKNSLILLFGILAISSCTTEDVQNRPIIQGVDSPVLTAPDDASTYTLLPENMTQQAERFVWSAANYNGDVAVSYSLEIDVAGGDFSTPQSLGGTNGALQLSVNVETLNGACLALGAAPYTPASFDVRVVSSASGLDMMASNKVTITVSPYTTETPKLWMPGSYQSDSGYGDNWTQSSAATLASEGFGNTNFEGYAYFASTQVSPNDGFKFTNAPDWNNGIFGDDGSFTGTLTSPGDNIGVTPGYYRVTANTTSLTYGLTATEWGIAGNATTNGWDGMIPMTYNPNTKKWSIIATLTTQASPDNGLKFKANGTWDINLGDNGADGSAEYGGNNIGTTAGTYLIELDLSNPRAYTYTLTPQ